MSSINYNRESMISADQYNYAVEKEDDAEFFSVANQYNERRAKMIDHRAMEAMNIVHNFNIKNNPKDLKDGQAKQEKTRKTRNDQQGREYICGECKSGYLSYPALYTHIKTKHGGVAPQGTIRGKNNNNKRRGRPKTLRRQPSLYHRNEPQSQFPAQYSKIVPKLELTFINLDDDNSDDEDAVYSTIQSALFKSQTKQLKNLSKKGSPADNKAAPVSTLPIIKVMAIFLHNIEHILKNKSDIMMTVQNAMVKLVNFVNSNYEKVLKQFQQISQYYIRKTIPPKFTYCSYQKCDYLPVFVDRFFKKLDPEEDQLQIDFLNDFCQWLSDKKLTYIKLVKPEVFEIGESAEDE